MPNKKNEPAHDVVIPSKHILAPIPHTTEGLRDALFDELNALRAGRSTPQKARIICSLAKEVIDSVRIQIQFDRVLLDRGKENKK